MATLESAVTTLWLVAAFVVGLIAAVPHPETHAFLRSASVLAVVLVTTFGGLVAVLMQRPDQVVSVTHAIAKRLPLVRGQALERLVRTLIEQVRLLLGNREASRRAALWGLGYWLLDAVCLYLSVLAFGVATNPGGLLATYALVGLIAMLPLTPGGLGLVEGVAVPVLVSFGTPHDAATPAPRPQRPRAERRRLFRTSGRSPARPARPPGRRRWASASRRAATSSRRG